MLVLAEVLLITSTAISGVFVLYLLFMPINLHYQTNVLTCYTRLEAVIHFSFLWSEH